MSLDKIRSKYLAQTGPRTIEIEVDGDKLGLIRPTVRVREQIAAKAQDGDAKLIAWAMVNLVVDLETGDPIFQDTDIDSLLDQEVGGTIDLFTPAIVDALVQDKEPKKL